LLSGNALGRWTGAIFVPLWGALTVALALGGPLAVVRDWLEKFAIWLVYASTAAITIALLVHGLNGNLRPPAVEANFTGTPTLLLGIDLVVAMPISWWPLISDYNRFARSSRDSALGTGLGYALANTVFYILGAGLALLAITAPGMNPADPMAFLAGAPRWRWSAFARWIPGAALYFIIVGFALPVGATLPSFALAAGLHVVFSRVESALSRPTATASGDP